MTPAEFIRARLDSGTLYQRPLPKEFVALAEAILEMHETWPVLVQSKPELAHDDDFVFDHITLQMTRQIQWLTTQEYRERFGDEPRSNAVVLKLAAIWSAHPDYREEWEG